MQVSPLKFTEFDNQQHSDRSGISNFQIILRSSSSLQRINCPTAALSRGTLQSDDMKCYGSLRALLGRDRVWSSLRCSITRHMK
jgi:hypothetical protein